MGTEVRDMREGNMVRSGLGVPEGIRRDEADLFVQLEAFERIRQEESGCKM